MSFPVTGNSRSHREPGVFKLTQFGASKPQEEFASNSKHTSRPRILALLTEAYGGYGGIAKFNRDLIEALSEEADVKILPRLAAPLPVLPNHVFQLAPAGNRLGYALKALSEHRWTTGGMIFCGHLNLLPVAILMKMQTGAPIWLQIHGIEAWKAAGVMKRIFLRSVDLVTSVSRATRDRFLAWAPVNPETIKVFAPSIDLDLFTPGRKSDELVKRWDLEGKRVLLTVGRLSSAERYKGHDRVIDALPAIRAQVPNVVYAIVGDGDDRLRLEKLALKRGVGECVIFVGSVSENCNGDKPPALVDWYRTADVFVMPSIGEGFGIVFLEALACGLPVIAGNQDGSRDALSDGELGALIDPHNRNQLVNAVVNAFDRSIHRNPLQKFSKDRFRERARQMLRKPPIYES